MRTLFIGNSHTFFNDMPNIFKEICKENGIDMQVAMLTKAEFVFPNTTELYCVLHTIFTPYLE